MATPAGKPGSTRDEAHLDEKFAGADEQTLDTNAPSFQDTQASIRKEAAIDLEKGVESGVGSTRSDDEINVGNDAPAEESTGSDPNIVDWDGPDDPENPQNWTKGRKWGLISVLAAVTLVTPLGSSFFAPGVPEVMRDFGESSNLLASFVVSVYILGFAFGPLIIAPLSEYYGRNWLYNGCNLFFVIFTLACAVSSNFNMLVGFRFLAGCAGAAPLTIGGGTIADMFPQEERAGAMAIWGMGPLLGPVVGPVAAGFLVQAKGWRWVFWVLTICSGAFALVFLVVGRETYAPTLLERKAARLRKETGNPNLRSKMASDIPQKELFLRAIVRPMKMLFLSPIVLLTSLFVAMNYGTLYLVFTTITFVFEGQYHFSSGSVGLSFLGAGIGMLAGMVILGTVSDKIIKKHQQLGDVIPEHRLPVVLTLPGSIALPAGLFLYGWTTYYKVHWIVPIIGTGFVGLGNLTAMMTIQTYLVDAFTMHAASAIAANTVLRSIFGALLPLAGLSMYDALGLGWGNSLLGFIAMALIPVLVIFRYYGERIRTNPKYQVRF